MNWLARAVLLAAVLVLTARVAEVPGGLGEGWVESRLAVLVTCVLPVSALEPPQVPQPEAPNRRLDAADQAANPGCGALGPDRSGAAWITEC